MYQLQTCDSCVYKVIFGQLCNIVPCVCSVHFFYSVIFLSLFFPFSTFILIDFNICGFNQVIYLVSEVVLWSVLQSSNPKITGWSLYVALRSASGIKLMPNLLCKLVHLWQTLQKEGEKNYNLIHISRKKDFIDALRQKSAIIIKMFVDTLI